MIVVPGEARGAASNDQLPLRRTEPVQQVTHRGRRREEAVGGARDGEDRDANGPERGQVVLAAGAAPLAPTQNSRPVNVPDASSTGVRDAGDAGWNRCSTRPIPSAVRTR